MVKKNLYYSLENKKNLIDTNNKDISLNRQLNLHSAPLLMFEYFYYITNFFLIITIFYP